MKKREVSVHRTTFEMEIRQNTTKARYKATGLSDLGNIDQTTALNM